MLPKKSKRKVVASGWSINHRAKTLASNRHRKPKAAVASPEPQPRWPSINVYKVDRRFDYKALPESASPFALCLRITPQIYCQAFTRSQTEVDEQKRWLRRSVKADWESSRNWRDYVWRAHHEPLLRHGVFDWETLRQAAQVGKAEYEQSQEFGPSANRSGNTKSSASLANGDPTATSTSLCKQLYTQRPWVSRSNTVTSHKADRISKLLSANPSKFVHKRRGACIVAQSATLKYSPITPHNPVKSSPAIVIREDTSLSTPVLTDASRQQSSQAQELLDREQTPAIPASPCAQQPEHPRNTLTTPVVGGMSVSSPTTASTEQSIKSLIHSLHSIQQHIHPSTFHPSQQSDLNDTITETASNIAALRDHVSPTVNPSNPIHGLSIAPEAIDYVDAGRNPDIYTREFVELVQRGNSVMNGKQKAFKDFSKILATDLKEAFGGIDEEVDLVMSSAGMVERGGKWIEVDESEDIVHGRSHSNGVKH